MKSLLGMLFTLAVLFMVIGGGVLLWYLSDTVEISRTPAVTGSP